MLATLILNVALAASPIVAYQTASEGAVPHLLAKDAPADPAALQDAITKLQNAGVIDDPKLWMEYSKPGYSIESAEVHDLLMAAAKKFERVDSVDAAIEVLKSNKVLANAEYWHAVANRPKVPGNLTALLLLTLARGIK